MTARRVRNDVLDFAALRRELDVPGSFPVEVTEAARRAATGTDEPGELLDATDVELVTLDPPGSLDLDQALGLVPRAGGGWVLHYAIADVARVVPAGGAVDAEARRRVETIYLPDGSAPLHPRPLSEDAASLLPDRERSALLWRVELDADAEVVGRALRRAVVRSRARLDYPAVHADLAAGTAPDPMVQLSLLGPRLQERSLALGAVDLGLPEQVVERTDGGWTLRRRAQLPVEGWNAQLSLLTGREAARLMLSAGVGVLRTLPAPDPDAVARLRRAAPGLDVEWPEGAAVGRVLATLSPDRPRHLAFLDLAAELLRGAGYRAFDGEVPPPEEAVHAGVGGAYAHVTAPIRRLVDRFAGEACVAVADGREVPAWVCEALPELPGRMAEGSRRARAAERAAIDLTEAWLLQGREGEVFPAAVVDVDDDRDRATVSLDDPAVLAPCAGGGLRPGQRAEVRLVTADPATRTVRFEPV